MGQIVQAFNESAGLMHIVLVLGLALWASVVVQIRVRQKMNFTPLLWAGLATLLLVGLLCNCWAVIEMFMALDGLGQEERVNVISRGISTFMNVTSLATMMAIPACMGAGVASLLVRRTRQRLANEEA